MPLIDIDQDLFDYLMAHEAITGETPSDCIRKLLRQPAGRRQTQGRVRGGTVIARFLSILAEIHRRNPGHFAERIGRVRGRDRIYFSRSPEEIRASGSNTRPVEIPGTGWWVVGTTATPLKQQILESVCEELKCKPDDRLHWLAMLVGTGQMPVTSSPTIEDDDDPFKI